MFRALHVRRGGLQAIAGRDADLSEVVAVLHDAGYAPDRLVNLVAHHSYALLEAQMRGLADELAQFTDERGVIRDALWYCDQTTSPSGDHVTPQARVAEIRHRYGPGHIVTRFITEAAPELLAAVQRTEERITAPASS
jgi:hypothetical protein